MKGRYGTAVGRAVHAVLQTIDLTTGEGLDGRSRRAGRLPRASSAASARSSALQRLRWSRRRSARRHAPHWRETYVAVPLTTASGRI